MDRRDVDAATASWTGEPASAPVGPGEPAGGDDARYRILGELGRGGMATVYAALDTQLDRKVALKILHGDHGVAQPGRLLREAQALARLRHPCVVTVFDVGTRAGRVFVAMELVPGTSLRTWLHAQPRTPAEITRVCLDAARGLAAAHAVGLIHRDFKPDNVVIDDAGAARVIDFGLARLAALDDAPGPESPGPDAPPPSGDVALDRTITRDGAIVGTLPYIAPEVYRGEPGTAASDQWAFGVTLCEALTGARPFAATEFGAWVELHRGRPAPTIGAAVSAWQRAIITRALADDPAARFPSMTALVAALERDPARQRRRWLLGAGVAAVAAGATAAIVLATTGPAAPAACPLASPDALWPPAQRAAAEQAILASGHPAAAPLWAAAARQLTRYADALVAAERQACLDARGDRDRPQLVEARAICLARRRAEFESLTRALPGASRALVDRLNPAIDGLSPVAECAAADRLLGPVPRPPDDRAVGAALDRDLADLWMQHRLGRSAELSARADELLARAVAYGHPPTVALAHYYRATLLDTLDRHEEAAAGYRQAVLAAQAGRDDVMVSRAAAILSLTIGRHLRKPAEARPWAELALSTAQRLAPAPRLEERATFALGLLDKAEQKLDDAERHLGLALAACEQDGSEPWRCADITNALSGIALRRHAYDRAEALARRALAQFGDRGELIDSRLVYLSNLASVQHARGDFAGAAAVRADLLAKRTQLLGADHSRTTQLRLDYAASLERQGALADAEREARHVLAVAIAQPAAADLELRARVQLASILAAGPDPAAAADELATLRAWPGVVPPPAAADIELIDARIAAARRQPRIAIAHADASIAVADQAGLRDMTLADALALRAELARAAGDLPTARAAAARAVDVAAEVWGPDAAPLVRMRAQLAALPPAAPG